MMRIPVWALTAVLLLAAACGSGDSTEDTAPVDPATEDAPSTAASEGPADEPEPEPEPEAESEPEPEPAFDGQVWVDDLIAAHDAWKEANRDAGDRYFDRLFQGAGEDPFQAIDASVELYEATVPAHSAFDAAAPAVPDDDALAGDYEAFLVAMRGNGSASQDFLDTHAELGDELARELDEFGGDPGGALTTAEELWVAVGQASEATDAACLTLASAIDAAGLTGFRCTVDPVELDESVDPTTTPTGNIVAGLDAGSYDFAVLDRPFSIELAEPFDVRTGPSVVEFISPDNDEFYFYVVALDQLADPAGEYSVNNPEDLIPVPDDIDAWVAELPVALTEVGEVTLGDRSFAYWDITANLPEDDPRYNGDFAFTRFDDFPFNLQIFSVGDNRIWLTDSDAGTVMVFAHSVVWSGIPHGDLVAWVEETLTSASFG